ncbi:phytosulfokines-like [Primulina eburnea]|uniref:phytosulfokines-like n=1 Tax=Primulina eburnea TaxID=1245227 RepID=UPI003C6CB203
MSKATAKVVFLMALLLFSSFSLSFSTLPDHPPLHIDQVEAKQEVLEVENSCKGIGDEECLMRRSLAAHIDYIYTQQNKP